ncbi:hypothetical protein BN889_04942 [Pseudomonas aeruginosa PA38182]|nr:hypothetical protein BN889_04942 [Pseudomonas aeruginosa PA38182]
MVSGGDEADAVLPRAVHGLLGNLAGQVGIDASGDRLVDIALGAAGAPGDAPDRLTGIDQQRLTPQRIAHMPSEIGRLHRLGKRTEEDDGTRVARLQRPFHFEAELPGELHVVAHLRMQIQRQVVSEQTDIVVQQGLQAPLLHADHAGVLTLPEVTVMHQHHVGVGLHGGIQQRLAGSDPADDPPHLRPAFDLQAVRAVVLDARGIQITVGLFDQGAQGDSHANSSSFRQGAPLL